jgi:Na+/melibiose symporter and related transporters
MTTRPLALAEIIKMSFGFLGIQFGWGLQMANMSAIYQYLGASESEIPLLWLAAPVTGLVVQPIIGYYSDRTWTRLGRRRPYFLVGAILASGALIAMPNSSTLWMAAGLLWILDASVNVSMEPFRAFVGDLLPPEQRKVGFAMQSLLIGLGAILSSSLPWLLTNVFGMASGVGDTGSRIPLTVHVSFYIGAAVFFGAVLYTVLTTREHPPENLAEFEREKAASAGVGRAFGEIFGGVRAMPSAMKRLAVVQFFTWFGLFCLWIYFAPAIARSLFGGAPGTEAYQRGIEWGGVCFATYNGVAFAFAFALIPLARRFFGADDSPRVPARGGGGIFVGRRVAESDLAARVDDRNRRGLGEHPVDAVCAAGECDPGGAHGILHGRFQLLHRATADRGVGDSRADRRGLVRRAGDQRDSVRRRVDDGGGDRVELGGGVAGSASATKVRAGAVARRRFGDACATGSRAVRDRGRGRAGVARSRRECRRA